MPDRRVAGRTLRSGVDLARAGLLPAAASCADAVAERYAVAVTPHVASLMRPGDPDDPIARQYLPHEAELQDDDAELSDPIGEARFTPVKGVVHRYPDRALLKPILACPVYCRFCFRRETVGAGAAGLTMRELDAAIAYIGGRAEVWEVILTGGDPLLLSPRRLGDIVRRLAAIAHVGVVRIHTRVPVADPDRITAGLADALQADVPVYVAIHCNHPRELDEGARRACRRLAQAGLPLLGQTVLLKGVNDDATTLAELMRLLVRNRIKPYYLHHPDLAPGTARFRLTIAEGRALMRALRGRVSGLCQPTYVLDIPGGHGKVPVGPGYLAEGEVGPVTDYRGRRHAYPPVAPPRTG